MLLLGTALDAYSFGGVPIPWLAQAGAIVALGLVMPSRVRQLPPGLPWFLLLLAWSFLVTGVGVLGGRYASLLPSGATTPYPIFVGLRLLVLVSFGSFLLLAWKLLELGLERELLRWIVILGVGVAVAAMYIYLAHVYGWLEPARTRMGTSGTAQPVRFTYAFHRALGTFREPSHLAAWLIVPLFFSFVWAKRALNIPAILMATALFLTGSTTGVLAVSAGLAAGLLLNHPLRGKSLLASGRVALNLVAALLVFKILVVPYDDPSAGYIADANPRSVLRAPGPLPPAPPPPAAPAAEAPAAPAAEAPAAPAAPGRSARQVPPPLPGATEELRREGADLGQVVFRRLRDLVTKGPIGGSNRDYVYRFVKDHPPGLVGVGLGNANLVLTRYLQAPLIVSYLSLYLYFAYATGIIGCALLLAFLLHPILGALRGRLQAAGERIPLVAALVGWLVVFAAASEELALSFAVAYAMLAFRLRRAPDQVPV